MSFSEKLATGIGNIGETLFGTGRLNYARGQLLAGRLGATEALTDRRRAQTRDLDYSHANRLKLAERLAGNDRMTNAFLHGDFSDYVPSSIQDANFVAKQKALEDMAIKNPGLAQALNAGMTGPQFATMNRTNLLAPQEKLVMQNQMDLAKLLNEERIASSQNQQQIARDQFGLLADEFDLKQNESESRTSLAQELNRANVGYKNQQTTNLIAQGIMDQQTGMLNIQKIQTEMGNANAESAIKINNLRIKGEMDRAEYKKKFEEAQEKLKQLQDKGQDLRTAMKNMAKIKVKGDVTLADFAAVGATKEASAKILGGSQVGGTAAFQVIDKIKTRLAEDMDTEYPVRGKDGKIVNMAYPYMNKEQRDIVFEAELEQYVDVMAKYLNVSPDTARQRLKDAAKNSKGGALSNALKQESGKRDYRKEMELFKKNR